MTDVVDFGEPHMAEDITSCIVVVPQCDTVILPALVCSINDILDFVISMIIS